MDLPANVQLAPQHVFDLDLEAVGGLVVQRGRVGLDPVEDEVVSPATVDFVETVLEI